MTEPLYGLPFCVLTYRQGPNGNDIYEAIPQSDELEAHAVANALSATGQPTWVLSPWEAHMEQHRYHNEDGNHDG